MFIFSRKMECGFIFSRKIILFLKRLDGIWNANKPLPEPMLNKIYLVISRHKPITFVGCFGKPDCVITGLVCLTHSGRVKHICISKLTIIGSNNGFSPDRWQAIIWTNTGILLIGSLGTNFNRNSYIFIHKNCISICHLQNGIDFVSASMC